MQSKKGTKSVYSRLVIPQLGLLLMTPLKDLIEAARPRMSSDLGSHSLIVHDSLQRIIVVQKYSYQK
jgi:hypothetical protein